MRTIAPDGTVISTVDTGAGPPIVLVGGSTYDAAAMSGVATALSDTFTCFAVDRRGRGSSGDGDNFAIEREYDDLAAVIASIGEPVTLLGHSYGALCALGVVRLGANVNRLVLYEPPIPVDGPPNPATMQQARDLVAEGDSRTALLTLLRDVVQLSVDELGFVAALPEAWFSEVVPTALREFEAVGQLDPEPNRYADINIETLLLLGTNSPSNITSATRRLAQAIAKSRVALLEGQAHNAILAAPHLVAAEIRSFAS